MDRRHARNEWLATYILPHESAIRRKVARYAGASGVEVDDIIQEMYSVLVRLPSTAGIRMPFAYALQVARSLIHSHVRRLKVVSIELAANLEHYAGAIDANTPETNLHTQNELRRVASAMDAMPEAVRSVFHMRRVEGRPLREIADILGLSENTVEKQISRAIQILASQFLHDRITPARASYVDVSTTESLQVNARAQRRTGD